MAKSRAEGVKSWVGEDDGSGMGPMENKLQRMIEEARVLTKQWLTSRECGFTLPEVPGEFVRPEEGARGGGGEATGRLPSEGQRG